MEDSRYLRNANAKLASPMLHDSPPGFIEYVSNSGTNICEQANRISKEIGGSEDAVELSENFLSIVEENPALQIRNSQPSILQPESVEFQSSIAQISKCHSQDIECDSKRVPARQSSDTEIKQAQM